MAKNYYCAKCGATFENQTTKPKCSAKPACKQGLFVNEVKESKEEDALEAPQSYSVDMSSTVRNGYTGGGLHKPSGPVYIHKDGSYAIAVDGSTHSSGNAAWKGFKKTSAGWIYLGSYDRELNKVNRGGGTAVASKLPQ